MKVPTHKLLVVLLILAVVGLTAVGAGGLLGPVYLLAALAIGARALYRSPTRDYISFTMLLWMFSPFVRRLIDWQSGRHDYSLAILAPLAVTLLAVFGLPRRWPRAAARTAAPFLVYVLIVLYGLGLGLINGRAFGAIYATMTWVAPIFFALLIIAHSSAVNEIRNTLTRTVIGGSVVMSLYGVFQFVTAPPWDVAWMIAADMASIGRPEPFMIRVFSTMNAPGPFAVTLAGAVLLLFGKLSARSVAAGAVMILGLALSLVRSSWGAASIGIMLLMIFGNARIKFRIVATVVLVGLAAMPLLTRSEFFDTVADRFSTLTSIEDDRSLQARREFTYRMLEDFGQLLLGRGLGSTGIATNLAQGSDTIVSFDNGWLNLVFTFGFMGFVMAAILVLWAFELIRSIRARPDNAAVAIIPFVLITLLIFSNTLNSPTGMFLFPYLACTLAALAPRQAKSRATTLRHEGVQPENQEA